MRQCYLPKTFSETHEAIIDQANEIIEEYEAEGFSLTLRQLYYQFVSRDLLPNTVQSYKRLGGIIADARNAGLIDWDTIEDRTRNLRQASHWESPKDILEACAQQFRYDLWRSQPFRVEVWIEKDALSGVFEPVCNRLDVPLFACRGYTSKSELRAAGRRMLHQAEALQTCVVLHFGDHDPSGLDMTRDVERWLSVYAEHRIAVQRLALNWDQIGRYNPPPNPAKSTDSRFKAYAAEYGRNSWELDALEPAVLASLVETAVDDYRNKSLWDDAVEAQQLARQRLRRLADEWDD